MIDEIFTTTIERNGNFIEIYDEAIPENQSQTADAFSKKWSDYELSEEKEKFYKMQKEWYLKLYGFDKEESFANFLRDKRYIFDAGCGLGYKSAWFAKLSPLSTVLAMDLSDSIYIAANNYKHIKNLYFIKRNIADTRIKDDSLNYISCDQVLQHTEDPEATFKELKRTLSIGGEFSCYVYKKKALPRELLDNHFRTECKKLTHEELLEFSEQLTELGKRLSELKIKVDIPDIPVLNIKGGNYDIQRFIYWNFLKCYWNENLGYESSAMVNYDWYSPSNAKRFTKEEFLNMVYESGLVIKHFHEENACYSGRFVK